MTKHTLPAPAWLFIDLDGTLVDTLPQLRKAFFAFGASQGFALTTADFDTYNGATLQKIVGDFKKKHRLKGSVRTLHAEYVSTLHNLYCFAKVRADAPSALRNLRAQGWHLALVTSAPRALATSLLAHNQIENLFSFMVTGDEVTTGKPHPAIYEEAKRRAGKGSYVALEDSENGLTSADRAGVLTFKFTTEKGFFCVGSFRELQARFTLGQGHPMVIGSLPPGLAYKETGAFRAPQSLIRTVALHWEKARRKNPKLFDGKSLVLSGPAQGGVLEAKHIAYRFVEHMLSTKTHGQFVSVAVTGIVRQGASYLLAERSASVSGLTSVYEFAPAGGATPGQTPRTQLLLELKEELGLSPSHVVSLRQTGALLSVAERFIDIVFTLELAKDAKPHISYEHHGLMSVSPMKLTNKLRSTPGRFHPLVALVACNAIARACLVEGKNPARLSAR